MAIQLIYSVTDNIISSRTQIASLESLPVTIKAFLFGVIQACSKNSSRSATKLEVADFIKSEFEEINPSDSWFSKQTKLLNDHSAIQQRTIKVNGLSFKNYSINKIEPLLIMESSFLEEKSKPKYEHRTKKVAKQELSLIKRDQSKSYVELAQVYPRYSGPGFLFGFLDQSFRLSDKDKRPEIESVCKFYYRDQNDKKVVENAFIRTSTSTDSVYKKAGISLLADLRLVGVLLTAFYEEVLLGPKYKDAFWLIDSLGDESVERKQAIDRFATQLQTEEVTFDVVKAAESIGLKDDPVNRKSVVDIVDRLVQTNFNINCENAPQLSKMFANGSDQFDYRIITERKSLKDSADKAATQPDLFGNSNASNNARKFMPRYYSIKFHTLTIQQLLLNRLYNRHPDLRFDPNGVVHRFYNWARGHMHNYRYFTTREEAHVTQLHLLKAELLDSAREDHFVEAFENQVKRRAAILANFHFPEIPSKKNFPVIKSPGHLKFYSYKLHDHDLEHLKKSLKNQDIFIALWHGYLVELDYCTESIRDFMVRKNVPRPPSKKLYPLIRIWKNRVDEIVGENSIHAQLSRQQLKSLEV